MWALVSQWTVLSSPVTQKMSEKLGISRYQNLSHVEKTCLLLSAETLAMALLAEKTMRAERWLACLCTEEVKGILLSNGEGFEEMPESIANLSPTLGSPDPAWDSQEDMFFSLIVSKCNLVTNSFMHGWDSCKVLYPLELTAMNTGNLNLTIVYHVPYVKQEKET